MTTRRTVVAVCRVCADYATDHAALYRHGQTYRHLGNDRVRCPGQEDDGTDDRATPMTFAQFLSDFDGSLVAETLTALLGRTDVLLDAALSAKLTGTLARRELRGVPVTPTTFLFGLRAAHAGVPFPELIGPAALLACPGGPWHDPACADLFDGWAAARGMAELPDPLRVARELTADFGGTVAELALAVTGILADSRADARSVRGGRP